MPFPDESFDIVVNRHGSYEPKELFRVLKPGGLFITQQVGENNDHELVEMLLPNTPKQFDGHNLTNCSKALKEVGFSILESDEAYRTISFNSSGALVWFAKIIEWEFIGFSVDKCIKQLIDVETAIKTKGFVSGSTHRFYIVAKK